MTRRRPISVSDHAVLRWLERSAGIDIAALRAAIAGSAEVGRDLGARIIVIEGVKLVLSADRRRVVTVLQRDQDHRDLVEPVEIDATIRLGRAPKRRRGR